MCTELKITRSTFYDWPHAPRDVQIRAVAEGRLAELRTYARNGVPFDVATGLPVPEVRQASAEAAKADELSWYQHAGE